MSLVSAILFNAPPPAFVGQVRKIIAREMAYSPRRDDVGGNKPMLGGHAISRQIAADVLKMLRAGGRLTVKDFVDEIDASQTAIQRQLNSLYSMGVVERTACRRGQRHPVFYWIKQ